MDFYHEIKNRKMKKLKKFRNANKTLILYEAPHKIKKL